MNHLRRQIAVRRTSQRPRICAALMLVPGVFFIATFAALASGVEAHCAQAHKTAAALTSEERTCESCHAPEAKGFIDDPHTQPSRMQNGEGITCSSCHGTGKDHVASGGRDVPMSKLASALAEQVNGICLSCHQGKNSSIESSVHGKNGMSCIDCHRVHTSGAGNALLKAAQPELCYQCHGGVEPQFATPFRHRIDHGPVECSDCHDPHGSRNDLLPSATRQGTVCTNCHTDVAGPFTFEHAAVKAEGCTACHVPHGGQNSHLLIRADIDGICQQCHLPLPDPANGAHMNSSQNRAGVSRPCTDCHEDVHGSNVNPVFLRRN